MYVRATSLAADILEEVDGAWVAITLPLPSNAGAAVPSITSIACPAAGGCVIVGDYTTTTGLGEGLVEMCIRDRGEAP